MKKGAWLLSLAGVLAAYAPAAWAGWGPSRGPVGAKVEAKPVYAVIKTVAGEEVTYKVVETTSTCKKVVEKEECKEIVLKSFPRTEEGKAQADEYVAKIQKMRKKKSEDKASTE